MEFYREQTRARHRPRVRGTTLSIRYFGGDNVIRPCVFRCVRTMSPQRRTASSTARERYLIPTLVQIYLNATNHVYICIYINTYMYIMYVCTRSQLEIGSVSSSRSAQIERSARVTRIQRCGSPAILHFYLPRDLVTRSTRV